MRADSGLVSLSIVIFTTAMLLEGLLLLPIISSALKAQIQVFTAYLFMTSIVVWAIVGVATIVKRKF